MKLFDGHISIVVDPIRVSCHFDPFHFASVDQIIISVEPGVPGLTRAPSATSATGLHRQHELPEPLDP